MLNRIMMIGSASVYLATMSFSPSQAQTPVPKGTVEIPKCLVFKGNTNNKDTFVPCNGVIPVGIDGNPIDWSAIGQGSPTTPGSTSIITDGTAVGASHPLTVSDITLASSSNLLGSPAPTRAVMFGGRDGAGNIRPILVDSAGVVQVNCPSCSGGNAGGENGGSNAAASAVGSDVPAYGSYTAYLGEDNMLHGWKGDNLGHPYVTIFGTPNVAVTNFPSIQAVSVASLPLPSGATTADAQAAANAKLDTLIANQSTSLPSGGNTIGNVGGVRVHYQESRVALAANGSVNGQTRDDGGDLSGVPTKWNNFNCFMNTDRSGTLNLQMSDNGTTWITAITTALDGSSSYTLTHQLFTKYWRCQVINGAQAQGFLYLNSGFSD